MSQRPRSTALPEIESIERLESIERDYAKQFGAQPFNVSHWDATADFENGIAAHLRFPSLSVLTSYRFSYQLSESELIVDKLGGASESHRALITPSSSTSIVCILNWLVNRSRKSIHVICPAYFSIFHVCRHFGIQTNCTYMKRVDGKFALPPRDAKIWREPSVLWITNPVYGAGVYFSQDDVAFLCSLLESGWTVIADECLCFPGKELIRTLGKYENFVSIYSPHKCVCINGVKFSIVIFKAKHLALIERWSDIWYGGINFSSSVAMTHFLSPNFDSFCEVFQRAIASSRQGFITICQVNGVDLDQNANGHFVSCYFPQLASRLGNSSHFLRDLIYATGGSIIPGNRSRYNSRFGFAFRVNLARSGRHLVPTLTRIVEYLASYSL